MPLNHLKLRHPELVETEKGLPAQRQPSLQEAFSGGPITADKFAKLTELLTSMLHEPGFVPFDDGGAFRIPSGRQVPEKQDYTGFPPG